MFDSHLTPFYEQVEKNNAIDFVECGELIEDFFASTDLDVSRNFDLWKTTVRDQVAAMREYFAMLPEQDFDVLSPAAKATFGVGAEPRILKNFCLPAKIATGSKVKLNHESEFDLLNPFKLIIDTRIGNKPVDIKTTFGRDNWSIPQECVNHWCLVIKVTYQTKKFGVGFVKARGYHLNPSNNRDIKRTLNAAGRNSIQWLFRKESYA